MLTSLLLSHINLKYVNKLAKTISRENDGGKDEFFKGFLADY
jgi:hypothetical protein